MDKRFLQSLLKRFGDFTRGEVEHYALLAELRQESERLAFRRAVYDMMDERRRRAERLALERALVTNPRAEDFIRQPDEFQRYLDEEEWHGILSRLPLPARMLAHIAKTEAEAFARDPQWTLCKAQRAILLAQIKQRFKAWHKRHSEAAFETARGQLSAALRRNRRPGEYRNRKA